MSCKTSKDRILRLKEEERAIILAHNHQRPQIIDIADFTGDSLDFCEQASETDACMHHVARYILFMTNKLTASTEKNENILVRSTN